MYKNNSNCRKTKEKLKFIYQKNYLFGSFDKEFSPFDYYLNGGYINNCKRICVCTNQEFVSNNEICDLCGGFIVRN